MGILDLEIMNSALKLRWVWKAHTAGDRSWSILLNPLEYNNRQLKLRLEWFWEMGSDATSGRIDGLRGPLLQILHQMLLALSQQSSEKEERLQMQW